MSSASQHIEYPCFRHWTKGDIEDLILMHRVRYSNAKIGFWPMRGWPRFLLHVLRTDLLQNSVNCYEKKLHSRKEIYVLDNSLLPLHTGSSKKSRVWAGEDLQLLYAQVRQVLSLTSISLLHCWWQPNAKLEYWKSKMKKWSLNAINTRHPASLNDASRLKYLSYLYL